LEAAYDDVLSPMGISWDQLRDHPHGLNSHAPGGYAKHAETRADGTMKGFATASGKVDLFLDGWAAQGVEPLPRYREPAECHRSVRALAGRFPLILTNPKKAHYLHSQHRGVAALRSLEPQPTAEIHPDTAAQHGIRDKQWIEIRTPRGTVRALADVTTAIRP